MSERRIRLPRAVEPFVCPACYSTEVQRGDGKDYGDSCTDWMYCESCELQWKASSTIEYSFGCIELDGEFFDAGFPEWKQVRFCRNCGSTNVWTDATAHWDRDSGQWKLGNVYESNEKGCNDCGFHGTVVSGYEGLRVVARLQDTVTVLLCSSVEHGKSYRVVSDAEYGELYSLHTTSFTEALNAAVALLDKAKEEGYAQLG
jgi:hypothetical protein